MFLLKISLGLLLLKMGIWFSCFGKGCIGCIIFSFWGVLLMVGVGWVIIGGGVMGMAIGLVWVRIRGVSRESMDDEVG